MASRRTARERAQRMTVIVNPHASAVDRELRNLVIAALSSRFEVTARDTSHRGHATAIAREAAQDGAELVVTVGGDGTVNEAAGALAGTDVALYPLPGGSQNVYAKLLGIPADVVDATSLLIGLEGEIPTRRVDVGTAGDRVFTFCAGAGIDADTVELVESRPDRKARWREWYYMAAVGRVAAGRYLTRPPRLDVRSDGTQATGITVLVQNGPSYTYAGDRPIEACAGVALDDGRISAAVLLPNIPGLPTVALRLYSRRLEARRHRGIETLDHVESVTVGAQRGETMAVQADGDFVGRFETITFGVLPRALGVVDVGQAVGVTR